MGQTITFVGTESYHEAKSEDHLKEVAFDYVSDWWSDKLEASSNDDYDVSFFYLSNPAIPEDELSTNTLSDRLADASEWLEENYSKFDQRASIQILDWIEKDGDSWPLGVAYIGTALTGSTRKTGITNVYRFESPSYYFSELEESGTAFHELLHNYDVRHSHGAVSSSDNASFIQSATFDKGDENCYWHGDSIQRTDWISPCSKSIARKHMRDNL